MHDIKWDAKEYHKYSSGQQKWAEELLDKLQLNKNDSVLDLGCGDGKITVKIANRLRNGFAVGVDNSDSMIKLAKEKYPLEKFKNLEFKVMDAKNLSFVNKFDVVFSNAALHWVDDHLTVFKGINRSLKPGGRILIQTGGKGNAAAAFEIIGEMTSMPEWSYYLIGAESPYHFFSDAEYLSLIQGAGLKPLRVELLNKDMTHEGIEGFKGFIRTTWLPFTLRIPDKKREDFISAAADIYIKKHPIDKEGKVHIGMVRLEVEAIKEL